jgi:hypothetical protein
MLHPKSQALLGCTQLQELQLTAGSVDALDLHCVGGLTPTLTALTCSVRGRVTVNVISTMLPAQTPIAAFTLVGDLHPSCLQGIMQLLAAHAPRLQELSLQAYREHVAAVPQPCPHLQLLTNLRALCLAGGQLVESLAPALPAMPALRRLRLPHSTLPMQPSVLAALTQLSYLQLGARYCHVRAAGRAHYESYLPAIRQMRGLSELVLDIPRLLITEPELREMLPLAAWLHRLDVNWATEESEARIRRVLGPYVRQIVFYSATE